MNLTSEHPALWEIGVPHCDEGGGSISGTAGWNVFEAVWSGGSYGNSATVVAKFKLDTRRLGSPGDYVDGVGNWLTDIELKVVGAREGNGRFITSDFDGALFHCSGALDFTQPLLEQPGFLDFNLFGRHGCPEGSYEQELTLPGDLGERLTLTRLAVVASGILERK